MGTSVTAGRRSRSGRAPSFAARAFVLGLASPFLLVAGFGWIPFAFDLSALTALASLIYGIRTFRRPRQTRSTALAVSGVVFALLALFVFAWIYVAFAINPPE